MWMHELSRNEIFARRTTKIRWITIAERCDSLVVLAKKCDRARKIGHEQQVAARLEVARLTHGVSDE